MSTEKEVEKKDGEVFLIAEEVAIKEIKEFIEYHQDITISTNRASDQFMDIAKDFKEILKAFKRGLLNIEDMDAPVLKLNKPIVSENGNFNTEKIAFRTRITKGTMATLTKGFDVGKNPIGFSNILTAYYAQLDSVSMLEKFGKTDLKIIDEMVSLFQ